MDIQEYAKGFNRPSLVEIAEQSKRRDRDDNALLERVNNDDAVLDLRRQLTLTAKNRTGEAMRVEAINMISEVNGEIAMYMNQGKINANTVLQNPKYKKLLVFGTTEAFGLQKTFEDYVRLLVDKVNVG